MRMGEESSAAERTETYFRNVVEASSNCIAVLDFNGAVEFVNPYGRSAMSLGDQPAPGSWRALWNGHQQCEIDAVLAVARTGEPARFRSFRAGNDETPGVWWDTTVSPVRGDDGIVQRLLASSKNVTSQIEGAAFLDAVIDNVPAMLFAKSIPDGRYVLLNRAAEQIFGVSRESMLGKTDEELFDDDEIRSSRESDAAVIRSGKVNEHQSILDTPAGPRTFCVRKMATYGDDGPRHLIGVVEDISDQLEAAAALQAAADSADQASRSKGEFLANMSHEIRTPLNGVIGVADVLARTELDSRQSEMVEIIRSSGAILERLLADVLDLARIEAGQVAIEVEPFHLGDALRSIVGLLKAAADEKSIALILDIPTDAETRVIGDVVRMRQILTNLLSNAVKFTAVGEVRLSVEAPGVRGDGFRFSVRDTGVGFDSHQKDRVFTRFQQADGSITRRFGGTGLGLSISRELADLMGGTLDCESQPGLGSVFTVELPLPPAPASMDAEAISERIEHCRLRVLLADDHPTNRKVVELILAHADVDLVSVENGLEAVEAYKAATFDVVLMDMQMPVMDGVAATRKIRAYERRVGVPPTHIVMLTANALQDHVATCRAAGADQHLAKPVTAQALLSALAETVQEPEETWLVA
jgi:PAS domain S-box-containing protein